MYSPLEQFDQTNWLINRIFEIKNSFFCFISEIEFDTFSLFTNSYSSNFILPEGTGTSMLNNSIQLSFVIMLSFIIFISFFSIEKLCYAIVFLALINLITGFFINNWFFDYMYITQYISGDLDLTQISTLRDSSIIFNYRFSSQIDFTLSIDEILITFILGSLFISNNEENSDFILSEKADLLIVEKIVAPLFVSNIGKDVAENGALYIKVCTIFSFVLFSNLLGMIPYGDTATSSLILTFWVALSVFIAIVVLIIQKHGIDYFFSLFIPNGCPLALVFLLVPIEFLSYSFRLVSLAIRLFANRIAGHTLIKVLIGFSYVRFLLGDGFALAAFFPALVVFVLIFLEMAVAVIQAYIFFNSVLYLPKRIICNSLILKNNATT